MTVSPTRILGIDTSLRCTGLGIIDSDGSTLQIVQFGVIRNKPGLSVTECVGRIYSGISQIIAEEQPDVVAIEGVFYCKNVRTAVTLGEARGAVLAALSTAELVVHEYAPRRVKQAVAGYGAADKEQVRKMVISMLGIESTPPYDASDALAIAIC
ncbi:MAG: crossover junction endodeoxyribonuclease RuvC, partial [Lentisphaerae bacterium]|nr:crossover junction endodeoxyribonuclease RuvC [Lentisphaerota bacterium]